MALFLKDVAIISGYCVALGVIAYGVMLACFQFFEHWWRRSPQARGVALEDAAAERLGSVLRPKWSMEPPAHYRALAQKLSHQGHPDLAQEFLGAAETIEKLSEALRLRRVGSAPAFTADQESSDADGGDSPARPN